MREEIYAIVAWIDIKTLEVYSGVFLISIAEGDRISMKIFFLFKI